MNDFTPPMGSFEPHAHPDPGPHAAARPVQCWNDGILSYHCGTHVIDCSAQKQSVRGRHGMCFVRAVSPACRGASQLTCT